MDKTPFETLDAPALQLHFESILDSVPDAMVVTDEAGIILAFSRAAEKLFGYLAADMTGQPVARLMSGRDRANHDSYIGAYLRTGERQIIGRGRVVLAARADGTVFPIDLKVGEARIGERYLFTAFMRDLTEQQSAELRMQEMQAELVHFSRLSAVGTMASALAHELNQPLTAVANYLEASRDLIDSPDPDVKEILREALSEAAVQAVRAGDIVRKLRSYVSRGEVDAHAVPLAPLLADAIALSKISRDRADIPVKVEMAKGVDRVLADAIQIQQVVINLIRNAMDALADRQDGAIVLRAFQADEPGFVTIEVCDNGPGLPAEMQQILFKPFATTKSHGMGLGLSICQTIVEAHGGTIRAMPRPTGGSCFRFTLRQELARAV
ncbi:MAG: PAS domain S-box protein [Hyphomonas sp.]|uniref:sensor histidine kinase n=1 Tax=Hyphomonas sp. TaxID=87 RepID=UPI00182B4FF3|nr:PAS domain S-box protein [Hyphomonas sp.]MBA3070148.1 PAS domain S-box protein [Hyphomonas sp.]MBU3922330.1 PAS domain S-box protein [Alphaproteobacteria bacterium]MBU4060276.1 PAS domain S-box protein [Alphaproteobacteria bacterium]MBU4162944.1 PAS domain S-box protein [Alphaproteobacteria bacterium]